MMKVFRASVVGAVAFVIAAVVSADAADMPVKAPPPAPGSAVTNWSGAYVDGAFGWEWSRNTWTFNSPFLAVFAEAPVGAPFSNSTANPVLGFHLGYQQQFGWLVVGGEFGAIGQINDRFVMSAPSAATPIIGVPPCGVFVAISSTCESRIASVLTAGGKIGYASGDWLAYGVGGAAFDASVESRIVNTAGFSDSGTGGRGHGYYVGGGIDYILAKTSLADLIIGFEYEHVGLDAAQVCSDNQAIGGSPCNLATAASVLQRTVSAQQDVVWGKVTVKFNPFGW